MSARAWAGLLVATGVAVGTTGCSRANLYPITDESPRDAGARDQSAAEPAVESGTAPIRCPSPVQTAGNTNRTLQVGTRSRSYVLYIPSTYDGTKPSPLIVDFHSIGKSGAYQLSSSPYTAVADSEGVVMAFPDGLGGPAGTGWNVGSCCVAEDIDDLGFATALVADVQKTTCIDPDRVYAVGLATGGGMAYAVACHAAEVFAAVSSASFDLVKEDVGECIPSRPITVVSFRGTAEVEVPYDGGLSNLVRGMPITFLGAQATFEKWAQLDGCAGSPSAKDSRGCSTYSSCDDGVEVVLCTKQDGGEEFGDAGVAWPVLKRHVRRL